MQEILHQWLWYLSIYFSELYWIWVKWWQMFFLLQTLWLNFLSASLQHGSCSSCNQTDHVSLNAWDEGNEGKTGWSSDKPIACLIFTCFERVMSEEFAFRGSVPCFVWHKLCDVSMIIQVRSWYWHWGTLGRVWDDDEQWSSWNTFLCLLGKLLHYRGTSWKKELEPL